MIEAVVGVALRAILASVLLGGVLATLVLLATRTLALKAATRHALWTTALIATAAMPLAGIGVSLARAYADQPVAAVQHPAVPAAHDAPPARTAHTASNRPVTATTGTATTASSVNPLRAVADRLAFAAWTPRMSPRIALGIVGVWALGVLIGLIGLGMSILRVRGLKRRSNPLDGALADELPWLTDVETGREIYLRLSYEIETPVAIGFSRPVILIPTELATADGLAAIESLVLHEHAHLRRYDDWTNLVQRVIERLFWFNPIVWLVGRRIALEREIASDDAVVETTGAAHDYATSLWKLAREMRMPEHAVVAPGALLTRKQITVRIEQLLDAKRGQLHRSPAAAAGVALASLVAVGLVATSAPAVELPATAPVVAATEAPAPTAARMKTHAPSHRPLVVAKRTVTVTSNKSGETWVAASDATMPPAPTHTTTAPPMPTTPPVPVPVATDVHIHVSSNGTLSAEAKRKVNEANAAAHKAMEDAGIQNIGPEIGRQIGEALKNVPQQIAQEAGANRTSRHVSFDGVKLTREILGACTGCTFRNADGRGADLHGTSISGDDLRNVNLSGANLQGARFSGTDLRGANLTNADLRGATLSGVELRDANLDGARLDDVKLTGITLTHVSLHGTMLRSVVANCSGCDLTGMDLHGQDLHGITVSGNDLTNADLRGVNLRGAHLNGIDLSGANLAGADLSNAVLSGCDLSGAELRDARTTGMTLNGSSFGG
ncbi:MAG: pentapeptide repeat-containing protein [Candidatus Eremiobacteraeota bacterium]|nr:pentapeptide repeat-containing protein [Candidatus Eremiobacteraeota bacterium]